MCVCLIFRNYLILKSRAIRTKISRITTQDFKAQARGGSRIVMTSLFLCVEHGAQARDVLWPSLLHLPSTPPPLMRSPVQVTGSKLATFPVHFPPFFLLEIKFWLAPSQLHDDRPFLSGFLAEVFKFSRLSSTLWLSSFFKQYHWGYHWSIIVCHKNPSIFKCSVRFYEFMQLHSHHRDSVLRTFLSPQKVPSSAQPVPTGLNL